MRAASIFILALISLLLKPYHSRSHVVSPSLQPTAPPPTAGSDLPSTAISSSPTSSSQPPETPPLAAVASPPESGMPFLSSGGSDVPVPTGFGTTATNTTTVGPLPTTSDASGVVGIGPALIGIEAIVSLLLSLMICTLWV